MTAGRKRFLVSLIIASLPFLFFWSTGLFDFDEGIYAAVLSEMSRSGNWLIPVYNGEPWLEKPILIYWLTGPAVAAFGQQIGPRLPSVLCSIGIVAICGWFVDRRTDGARGRLTMWILGGSLLFTAVGNLMLADAMLLFGITTAILLWIESTISNPNWRYLSAFAMGFALLAKGPVAVFILVAVVVWTYFADPVRRDRVRKGWIPYVVIVAAVGCIWYVPAYLNRPAEFVETFVLQQNVGRLLGGDRAHGVPMYLYPIYYVVVLAVAFAPWAFLIKRVWPPREKGFDDDEFSARIVARWAVVVFLLFTLSGSKLPHYILPVVPACAVLLGLRLGWQADFYRMKYERLALAMIVFCTATNLILFPKYYEISGQRQAHRMAEYAKSRSGRLVTYLIRPPARTASISGELQEITLPSLSFYMNEFVPDFFTVGQLEKLHRDVFVLTRNDKLRDFDILELERSFRVERIDELSDESGYQMNTGKFELFRLSPKN